MNQLLPKQDVDQHNEIVIFGLRKTQQFFDQTEIHQYKLKRYKTESMQPFEKDLRKLPMHIYRITHFPQLAIKISYKPFKLP